MPDTEPSMTEMALYKICRAVYTQYKAQQTHKFSDSLTALHEAVENHLQITVDECDSEIIITFVLDRGDLNAS